MAIQIILDHSTCFRRQLHTGQFVPCVRECRNFISNMSGLVWNNLKKTVPLQSGTKTVHEWGPSCGHKCEDPSEFWAHLRANFWPILNCLGCNDVIEVIFSTFWQSNVQGQKMAQKSDLKWTASLVDRHKYGSTMEQFRLHSFLSVRLPSTAYHVTHMQEITVIFPIRKMQ